MKKQQTILITGASSGIGQSTAIKLAQEGHRVFAGVRRKADKIRLENSHKNITGVYIDVVNAASIDKAFWFIIKNVDKLDVLINNAGIVSAGPVELLSIERIKTQFDVNTFGPIMVAQKFLPLLANGKIINISSMASSGIFPFISAYCASKRALDIFFNSFGIENKDNIKVVSVKLASIKTPIWNKSVLEAKTNMAQLKESNRAKYENELNLLAKNAIENNYKGLEVSTAVNAISKIVNSKATKSSYNVGFAAYAAAFLSKLPQDFINSVIKTKLKNM